MKWKVDFTKCYGFSIIIGMKSPSLRWMKLPKNYINESPVPEYITEKIYAIALNGNIICDDEVITHKINYLDLIRSDWFLVEEVKEEPKKESYVTKEQIDEYNKRTGEYWNKTRDKKHCQEILSALQKEPINKIPSRQEQLDIANEGKTEEELNPVDFNIRKICREEIAKSEKSLKAMKGIKDAFNLAEKVIGTANKINKDMHDSLREKFNKIPEHILKRARENKDGIPDKYPNETTALQQELNRMNRVEVLMKQFSKTKKPKQEFDGDNIIMIYEDNRYLKLAPKSELLQISKWRLATQSDINKLFRGTKKRIDKNSGGLAFAETPETEKYSYIKKNFRIGNTRNFQTIHVKSITRNGCIIEETSITEKEYLEGIKNEQANQK